MTARCAPMAVWAGKSIGGGQKLPGKPNFVFEFKQGKDIASLAQEAMEQIHVKQYYTSLKGETILLGIAHNLKHCQIVSEIRPGQQSIN